MSAVVLLVLCNDLLLNGSVNEEISRSDGIVLLFFVTFLSYIFGISKVEGKDTIEVKIMSLAKISLYTILGFIGLVVGAKMVLESSLKIAKWFAVSDKLIALTIVAVGTSLPELFTSAVAAHRRKSDIAIGNIVGSNIFNIFFIMGISALITPCHFHSALNTDLLILCIASILLFITMFTGEKRSLDRWEAIFFIVFYGAYVVYLFIRK